MNNIAFSYCSIASLLVPSFLLFFFAATFLALQV
jgi:hypothetical protein